MAKHLTLDNDEIDEVEGETRTTKTKQDAYGINAQLTLTEDLLGYQESLWLLVRTLKHL
jgi:hypothetical protein